MSLTVTGVIGIVTLLTAMFIGIPISFSMLLVGFLGLVYLVSFKAAIGAMSSDLTFVFTMYSYSVIPAFVLMGQIAFEAGISRKLFDAIYPWVGRIKGGLGMASVAASAGFGAICGSAVATVATISASALPEMARYKYDKGFSAATVAAGSVLGVMIPPSVIFIIYGIITENSIGALFIAGIVPGILTMLLLMGAVYVQVLANPKLAPTGGPSTISLGKRLSLLGNGLIEILLVFVLVMGALMKGICTPTEAGGVGVAGVLLITVIRRQLSLKGFIKALSDTLKTSAFVFMAIAGVTVFGRFLATTRIPNGLASFVGGLDVAPIVVMLGILLIYFLAGLIIDPLPFIILTVPIFYPIVVSLGYDPIWFGVILVIVQGIGCITPPVGMMVYIAANAIKGLEVYDVFRRVWVFVLVMIIDILILLVFPEIITFLPNMLM